MILLFSILSCLLIFNPSSIGDANVIEPKAQVNQGSVVGSGCVVGANVKIPKGLKKEGKRKKSTQDFQIFLFINASILLLIILIEMEVKDSLVVYGPLAASYEAEWARQEHMITHKFVIYWLLLMCDCSCRSFLFILYSRFLFISIVHTLIFFSTPSRKFMTKS